jgi:hypothetical protein
MIFRQVALVSEIPQVSHSQLTVVSAALQKQLMRDFAPVWEIQASVDAFVQLEDVPLGYWPVMIRTDIGYAGAAGIHLDNEGQPFGLVQWSSTWPLTTSHEIMEMLVDPDGNQMRASNSIKKGQGRVQYLVEVCDPSEADQFGYSVNGITLSDFYTPHFFDPVASSSVRYSFTGAIKKPRQVLKDGYLSWLDPATGHWWQQTFFGKKATFRDLGVMAKGAKDLRSEIERLTPVRQKFHGWSKRPAPAARSANLLTAAIPPAKAPAANTTKARLWRSQITALQKQFGPK